MTEHELRDESIGLLQDLLRVDTSNPPGRETPAAIVLKDYLEANGVACELIAKDPDRANLVARIPGTGDGPSLALVGHTDVVPADAQDWRHPPFSGHLDDEGYLWGRGSVDMKNETATRAVTMAVLAREGFRPRGDLLFIAEADEEDGAEQVGMMWLVEARPDLRVDYALNEGGGERLELSDGRIVVPLEVGEKATLPTLVTALGEAGHASTPAAGANAVPRLAVLIQRLAEHRTAQRVLPQTQTMLEELVGPLNGDLEAALERAAPLHPSFRELLPPLFGTTIAPTRLRGSAARNVMPGRAAVECDCRVVPGTAEAELEAEFRSALGERSSVRARVPRAAERRDRLVPRDTARGRVPALSRRSRSRRDPASDHVDRLHRLALHAAVMGHDRVRVLAVQAYAERRVRKRLPQQGRADSHRRPRLRRRVPPRGVPGDRLARLVRRPDAGPEHGDRTLDTGLLRLLALRLGDPTRVLLPMRVRQGFEGRTGIGRCGESEFEFGGDDNLTGSVVSSNSTATESPGVHSGTDANVSVEPEVVLRAVPHDRRTVGKPVDSASNGGSNLSEDRWDVERHDNCPAPAPALLDDRLEPLHQFRLSAAPLHRGSRPSEAA